MTAKSACYNTHIQTGMMNGVSVPNRNFPASTNAMSPSVLPPGVVAPGSDPNDPPLAAAVVADSAAEVVPSVVEELLLPPPAGRSLLSPPEQPQSASAVSSSVFITSKCERNTHDGGYGHHRRDCVSA